MLEAQRGRRPGVALGRCQAVRPRRRRRRRSLVLRQPLPSLGHKKNNRLLDVHSKDVHAVDQPFWHAGRGRNQLEQQRARFSYLVLLRSVDSGNECRPRAV